MSDVPVNNSVKNSQISLNTPICFGFMPVNASVRDSSGCLKCKDYHACLAAMENKRKADDGRNYNI